MALTSKKQGTSTSISKKALSCDVLMLLCAPTERYPPSLHQTNLIAEAGASVLLADKKDPVFHGKIALHPSVRRLQPTRQWLSHYEPPPSFWRRAMAYAAFRLTAYLCDSFCSPSVRVAYDGYGCELLMRIKKPNCRTVLHFHEHVYPYEGQELRSLRRANCHALNVSNKADLIVFSDSHRAALFAERARLNKEPMVVVNCPRKIETLPRSLLPAILAEKGLSHRRVVLYQGSIGKGQCLDLIIRSMTKWPSDAVLILLGPCENKWRKQLIEIASYFNVVKNLVFLSPVSYDQVLGYTVGAELGLGLIAPISEHNVFSAGASNKRFEYMAAGIPQIVNRGPGISEIFKKRRCAIAVDPNSAEEIGEAVAFLLENETERQNMGLRGREAHLHEFNYEQQFKPVLDWIIASIS